MKRYIRIYKAILAINSAYIMAYRVSFINSIISSFSWGTFNIIWIILLTNKAKTVFGWKSEELVFITISYVIVTGLYYAFFARNFDALSRIIDRGELDSILLKPVDSQFHVNMMKISFGSLIRVLMGSILLIWWAQHYHYSIGIFQIISYVFLQAVGVSLLYSMWSFCTTFLIWYPNLGNLIELLYTLNGFARYPTELIQKSGILGLFIFLPISLICATPVKALLQKNSLPDALLMCLLSVLLLAFNRAWWKYALRHYTSAS